MNNNMLSWLNQSVYIERLTAGSDKIQAVLDEYEGDTADLETMVASAILYYCKDHDADPLEFMKNMLKRTVNTLRTLADKR